MSTLNIIGEFPESWNQPALRAAARELTLALAHTAPRACASALLIASNTEPPELDHPKCRVGVIPLHTSMLPFIWLGGTSARPLDGEFVHAMSPLVPLRRREEADGSQTSVTVLDTLAWDAPDALPKGQAKHIRYLTRRALKHADVIVTPTHAVAERLREIYGDATQIQVLPLAAPTEYLEPKDAKERREALGLPDTYLLSYACFGEVGRLEWLLTAYETHPELPPLVLVGPGADAPLTHWEHLRDRVHQVHTPELSDTGAIISGARVFAAPQRISDCLLPIHGALSAGVPIVHGGAACIAETAFDGGLHAETEEAFAEHLALLASDDTERNRLSVLAHDRSRMFSWQTTAWQLWEIHANI